MNPTILKAGFLLAASLSFMLVNSASVSSVVKKTYKTLKKKKGRLVIEPEKLSTL